MPGGNTGEQVQTYGRISHHLLRDLHLTALIDLHNKCLDNPDKHLGAIISCKNSKCSLLTSESPILPAHSWLVGAWNLGGVRARLCPAILPWHATKSRLVPTCAHLTTMSPPPPPPPPPSPAGPHHNGALPSPPPLQLSQSWASYLRRP